MGAIITEEILRENPELVKAFTGLPEYEFWSRVQGVAAQLPAYEHARRERALDHPATTLEAKKDAEPLLAELVAALPPEVIIATQTRGRARTVEQVVAEIMADDAPLNSGF